MYVTILLFVNNFIGYAISGIFISTIVLLSKVPPLFLLRGLRAIMYMLIISALINIFLTPGERVIFSLWVLRITLEGVLLATQMALRLTMLIIGSSLLTLTTTPIQLTHAIESLLSPLKPLGVPAHDIAMMMMIALRMIPALAEELDKIMKAQKARGAEFDTGNLIKRARSLLPILVPLFVSAFKRAEELSTAMEARCYRGDINRTRFKTMQTAPRDWVALGIMIVFCIAIFITRRL